MRRNRHAPTWVQDLSSQEAHSIVGSFDRQRCEKDLTDRQEWLYDVIVADLEWRRANTYPVWRSCSCRYCVAPF